MSAALGARKVIKRKGLFCGNRSSFETMQDAKDYITKLINRGQRGSNTLHAFGCRTCNTIHVGHPRRS